MATARKEGESFDDYKARRKIENQEHETRKRTGWVFHKGGKPFVRAEAERQRLINIGLFALTMQVFAAILPPVSE